MLLDEPLSALDLKLRQHMRAELRAIQKRTNVTFIYITHDQGEALAMSDRVGVMSHGRLQQVAVPQDIYNQPVNGFVASFVGENNIFTGKIGNISSSIGAVRDERRHLQGDGRAGCGNGRRSRSSTSGPSMPGSFAKPVNGENAIPVEIADVAFEGNFISIQARDAQGGILVAEARNDGQRLGAVAGREAAHGFRCRARRHSGRRNAGRERRAA